MFIRKTSQWVRVISAMAACLAFAPSVLGQFQGQGGQGGLGTGQGARQYLNNTMIGDALIEIDPETRSLIIIADEETNSHIGEVIKTMDKPKPQVLIKVVFVEVTYRDDLDFGVEGSFDNSNGSTTNLVQTAFGLANQGTGGIYNLIDKDWTVTLTALAEEGKFEVLSRPSVLARNNQEAIITVGQEVPRLSNTRFLDSGDQVSDVIYEDVGIILRVTPFITQKDMVEMIVAPEISAFADESIPIGLGLEAPVFNKRAAETVVVTLDGQTVVIGGLMEKNKTEAVRKVPFLGDIPGLGWAFRRKIKEDNTTELLIFLTPYIVEHPEELNAITAKERAQTKLTNEAFTEDDLNRFLDQPTAASEEPKEEPKKKRRSWFRKD